MTNPNVGGIGPYLPTSQVFPKELSSLLIVLNENYIATANAVNSRVICFFNTVEQPNGKQFYNSTDPQNLRFGFTKVITVGSIAQGATLTTPHNISNLFQITDYWANVITDVPDFRIVPYASATSITDQIQMQVTATDVVIVNGATAPAITSGDIILEYLKI